jgi:hypothetical protein
MKGMDSVKAVATIKSDTHTGHPSGVAAKAVAMRAA